MKSVILQLSCVSEYAEDMFTELAVDAHQVTQRCSQLSRRVSLLQQYTSHLSPADEDDGLSHSHFAAICHVFILYSMSVYNSSVRLSGNVDLYSA